MGDKEFMDFLGEEDRQRGLPLFIILCLREKIKSISEIYRSSLDAYKELNTTNDTDLKKELKSFILDLIKSSRLTVEQFDLVMGTQIIDDDDEEENDGD